MSTATIAPVHHRIHLPRRVVALVGTFAVGVVLGLAVGLAASQLGAPVRTALAPSDPALRGAATNNMSDAAYGVFWSLPAPTPAP